MAAKTMNVGMIGYKFMGKAHSHAWRSAPRFFDLNVVPGLKVVCGRHEEPLKEFADNWGWDEIDTDWRNLVARDDIDIIDIACPTFLHHDIAKAAAEARKHIFCEKPFTVSCEQARSLCEVVEGTGVVHYLNHNYRRCPAVVLAKQLIDDGRIGRVFHWRGAYLQSWIVDPSFPLTWQLRAETAGAGPHWDLNSHSVDLARYLVGEITSVMAMTAQFVSERALPDEATARAFEASAAAGKTGQVTVEDAAFMLVQFANGALGSFEATRFAPGRKNFNYFEIYGDRGSLVFDLERMNELRHFSQDDPECARGFRTIIATEPCHPYIAAWWPPGHVIGYEHEFVHAVADFLKAVETGGQIAPNFHDGMECIRVLEAGLESAKTGRKIDLPGGAA